MRIRWRKSKKSKKSEKSMTPSSTPKNPIGNKPQRSQITHKYYVRQALENVRSSQAPPGEEYALTILENNEELVGWMNFSGFRMSSSASSARRNAMADGLAGWRRAEVAVLEEGDVMDSDGSTSRSVTSASTVETSTSGPKRFGKSGIEIPGYSRIQVSAPRVQVGFRKVDWNAPTTSWLDEGYGVGPAGEIANFER
jgi:hypothetical protein